MKIPELDQELEGKNMAGFWKSRVPIHHAESPHIWKWNEVYDGLMKAKDSIGIDLAERRAIRLINPHIPVNSTSHTLQFTFSIVNPGEVARAHRHNMAAIRFVVKGKGAYTIVEGERFPMEEGDLILTPNWTWHDHFNGSNEPIIWLDGLDGPLIQSFNVLFFEEYEKEQQPLIHREGESRNRLGFARSPKTTGVERRGLPFRYAWSETYETLKTIGEVETDPYDGILLRYINPVAGGYTMATMSCEVQLLKAGKKTERHRHTSSVLYHVFQGKGRTFIGEGYLEWEKGDSFVIPLWQWHSHESHSGDEAILFSINDRPIMEALELYREE
jgi:1-hydroxy-2-naphthoate dioxygenase